MASNTPAAAGFVFCLVSAGTHLKPLWLHSSLGNYCLCAREAGKAGAAEKKKEHRSDSQSDGLCHACECKHDGKGIPCPCVSCGTSLR